MVGALHLQHVFATPQDLDQRSSLLLGVQPSKIQVSLRERERERERERLWPQSTYFAFKLDVVTRQSICKTTNICDTTSTSNYEHVNVLFNLYGSCSFVCFGIHMVLKHLRWAIDNHILVPGVEYSFPWNRILLKEYPQWTPLFQHCSNQLPSTQRIQ
jgi:hypothetical protein